MQKLHRLDLAELFLQRVPAHAEQPQQLLRADAVFRKQRRLYEVIVKLRHLRIGGIGQKLAPAAVIRKLFAALLKRLAELRDRRLDDAEKHFDKGRDIAPAFRVVANAERLVVIGNVLLYGVRKPEADQWAELPAEQIAADEAVEPAVSVIKRVDVTDEMELDTIGDRKTALFVIISDTDDTFNFVVSILYTQLFNLLCDKADDEYGGRLPVHVRCLLDEFANIGQIPKFEKLIATIRSREISASIILQSQSQLKAIYKDNADTIVGNCDTTLFLGGKEKTTLKEMSEILGKETIDSFNTSENRGREVSHGLNYQKLGKQLMTEDEIAVMDGGKCILQLRGVRPFFSDKYDITKHPNYKYLSDYDKKNTFDMEKHLRRRPALVKSDEPFDYYEISEADLQEDTAHE